MSFAAIEIGPFGHHVRQRSGFGDRQLAACDCSFERVVNLGFRTTRQRNLRPLDCLRHLRLRCDGIIADRSTHFGIPKVSDRQNRRTRSERPCRRSRWFPSLPSESRSSSRQGSPHPWRLRLVQHFARERSPNRGVSDIAQVGPCLDRRSSRVARRQVNSKSTKQKRDHSRKLSCPSPLSRPLERSATIFSATLFRLVLGQLAQSLQRPAPEAVVFPEPGRQGARPWRSRPGNRFAGGPRDWRGPVPPISAPSDAWRCPMPPDREIRPTDPSRSTGPARPEDRECAAAWDRPGS